MSLSQNSEGKAVGSRTEVWAQESPSLWRIRSWRGHGGSTVSENRRPSIRQERDAKSTGSRGFRRTGGAKQSSLRQERRNVQKAEGEETPCEGENPEAGSQRPGA